MSLESKMPEDRWIEPSRLRVFVRVEGNIRFNRKEINNNYEFDISSLDNVEELFDLIEAGINAYEDEKAGDKN